MQRALRLVAETANPFVTLRRRPRPGQSATICDPVEALMAVPVFTFDSAMWGALVGVSPNREAPGSALRFVIQTAEQIGGQFSSWGRTRASSAPLNARMQVSLTSSAALLHELRTPLTASIYALDTVDQTPLAAADEQAQSALRTLRLALAEALHVVQWWSETQQAGRVQPHIAPVSIEAALRQSLGLASQFASRAHITIAEDTPLALADELMLNRVFLNLIDNAFQHGRSGGTLEISTRAAADVVQVRFLSEGVIDEPALDEITRSAQAPDLPPESRAHGFGLGIVKSLLQEMGGHVSIESDWRLWTAFTVTLPAAHHERAPEA